MEYPRIGIFILVLGLTLRLQSDNTTPVNWSYVFCVLQNCMLKTLQKFYFNKLHLDFPTNLNKGKYDFP